MAQFARRWPLGVAAAVVIVACLALLQRRRVVPPDLPGRSGRVAESRRSEEIHHTARRVPDTLDGAAPPAAPADPDTDPGGPVLENAMNGTWDAVDMEAVRAALPDNLYWQLSVPTNDERVVEERAAERARWNVEYGKMLSGTGTEQEIRAYYDQRARLSGDYVEFVTYLLDHYETQLPEQDVALLKLAKRMHLARLEEVPRKVEEALERKRQQDAARAAWRADQDAFADPGDAAAQ